MLFSSRTAPRMFHCLDLYNHGEIMAKFTITRLLDTTRINKTDTGKQIPEFFEYMAQFVEQTVRNLRSGLTFTDNFAGESRTIDVKHGVPQVITASKTVTGIILTRAQSSIWLVNSFGWYYDRNNRLTIAARYNDIAGTDAVNTDVVPLEIVLFF